MEWIETLARTIVGPDTAPLIYLIEENPIFLPFVAANIAESFSMRTTSRQSRSLK